MHSPPYAYPMSADTTAQFAGYRIEAVAGRGGMGVVYRATQLGARPHRRAQGHRARACSAIRASASASCASRALAAAIEHPNVIPIYDAGEDDGQLYIAMRYVDGADLRERWSPREGRSRRRRPRRSSPRSAPRSTPRTRRPRAPRRQARQHPARARDDHVYLTDFGLAKHALDAAAA